MGSISSVLRVPASPRTSSRACRTTRLSIRSGGDFLHDSGGQPSGPNSLPSPSRPARAISTINQLLTQFKQAEDEKSLFWPYP